MLGIKIVLLPKYEPSKLSYYIKKYRPQHINSIPAFWECLLIDPKASSVDYSCIANAYYGGEAMDEEKKEAVNKLFLSGGGSVELLCGYGMTELTSAAATNFPFCNSKGSSGIPLPKINCSIVDEENNELTYGKDGEICFSGPTVMLGYYENELATNEMLQVHRDGKRWLHTGDVGHIAEDGQIYITGRIKRIIMTKGTDGMVTKLFPDRIEKTINSCTGVRECCVIEKSDDDRINVLIGCISISNNDFDCVKEEIIRKCKDELPEYMLPEELVLFESLPRTSRGKIDYLKIRELLAI